MHRCKQSNRLLNSHRVHSQPRRHQPKSTHRQINTSHSQSKIDKPGARPHGADITVQCESNDSHHAIGGHKCTKNQPPGSYHAGSSSLRQQNPRNRKHRGRGLNSLCPFQRPTISTYVPAQFHSQRNDHQRRKEKQQLDLSNSRNSHPREQCESRPNRRTHRGRCACPGRYAVFPNLSRNTRQRRELTVVRIILLIDCCFHDRSHIWRVREAAYPPMRSSSDEIHHLNSPHCRYPKNCHQRNQRSHIQQIEPAILAANLAVVIKELQHDPQQPECRNKSAEKSA